MTKTMELHFVMHESVLMLNSRNNPIGSGPYLPPNLFEKILDVRNKCSLIKYHN